jgi:XRE family transcriptional regulator, aerobic/anaerobic benzoate catabolism transcriptional regulator
VRFHKGNALYVWVYRYYNANMQNSSARTNSAPSLDTSNTKNPILIRLGDRVRKQRLASGLTRKELAVASQVSERHLANLESGTGNVSILVLTQISGALNVQAAFFLQGDVDQQRNQRIALVGLRGAGKSTLGALLAQQFSLPFFEMNHYIEQAAGCKLSEIHNLLGPTAYRRYERRALEEIIAKPSPLVLATPGGIVSDPQNYELLLTHCVTVWLQASPQDHMQRVVEQGDLRPMAGKPQAMADLRKILNSRSELYKRADLHWQTSGLTIQENLDQLTTQISQQTNMSAPI